MNPGGHSRPQRPRPFWSAPRIVTSGWTSGKVNHRKSAIHGLPVTLRMNRVKSEISDWLRLRRNACLENRTRGPFTEAPGYYRAHKATLFFIPVGSCKSFANYIIKILAKVTKGTSLEVRTHPTFLETDFKI